MRLFLTVACCLFFMLEGHTQYAYELFEKKHAASDLKKDVDLVRRTLEKGHPNLYLYIDKAQLTKKFDSLKRTITEPSTDEAFVMKLLGILGSIRDGHAYLYRDRSKISKEDLEKYEKPELFPIYQLEYKVIGKRLFVSKNLSPDTSLSAGTELLSIDHVPAADIIDAVFKLIPADGYSETLKYYILNNGRNLPGIYRAIYGVKDTLEVEVRNPKEIAPAMRWVVLHKIAGGVASETTAGQLPEASAPAITETSTKYLKVGSFMDQDGKDPGYVIFFKALRQNQVKNLILDLRGNMGGSIPRATQLLTFLVDTPGYFVKRPDQLIKGMLLPPLNKIRQRQIDYYKANRLAYLPIPDANNFKGKLYVLINGGSFSATTMVAANLLGKKNVTFVGQETGGGRNGWTAGEFEELILPESKVTLKFGIIPFEFTRQEGIKGRGVMPDIPIEYSMDDYLNKKDLELEWVLKDIAKSKTP